MNKTKKPNELQIAVLKALKNSNGGMNFGQIAKVQIQNGRKFPVSPSGVTTTAMEKAGWISKHEPAGAKYWKITEAGLLAIGATP